MGSELSKGEQTGKWIYYREDGSIVLDGEIVNGKQSGRWSMYHLYCKKNFLI